MGSEMCIRDRLYAVRVPAYLAVAGPPAVIRASLGLIRSRMTRAEVARDGGAYVK